tara:strand:- start:1485 stop:2354 length:870 start_codon:yes stop_codon:yes gene_type:complete
MIDGFLLINKPPHITSHSVVSKIRKIFNTRKVGHSGTLDPFANGLLIIAIGQATKFLPYVPHSPKTYHATVKLGQETDTYDTEGAITKELPIERLNKPQINQAIQQIALQETQQIPIFSAKRVNGTRLYEMARKNLPAEPVFKAIKIYRMDLLSFDDHYIEFKVSVSSGTYVRSIGYDLAKAVGSCGHLTYLQRIEIGNHLLKNAYAIDEIDQSSLIEPGEFLIDYIAINLDTEDVGKIASGLCLPTNLDNGIYRLMLKEQFFGLVIAENGILKAKRMMNTSILQVHAT